MARSAEINLSSDSRPRGNSDLVARAAEKILKLRFKACRNLSFSGPHGGDLFFVLISGLEEIQIVAGLEEIQIQWPAQRRNF